MVFIMISLVSVIPAFNQELPDKLLHGFQTGNPEELSAHFTDRLQMTIQTNDYRVSKIQATELLREFFKNNPPSSFSVLFKGNKKDSNFAVGKLVTKGNSYRITIFFTKMEGKNLIHLLEIEKENATAF